MIPEISNEDLLLMEDDIRVGENPDHESVNRLIAAYRALRRVYSCVPARIAIEAKEAAGFSDSIRLMSGQLLFVKLRCLKCGTVAWVGGVQAHGSCVPDTAEADTVCSHKYDGDETHEIIEWKSRGEDNNPS